jgi:hypothetical protein
LLSCEAQDDIHILGTRHQSEHANIVGLLSTTKENQKDVTSSTSTGMTPPMVSQPSPRMAKSLPSGVSFAQDESASLNQNQVIDSCPRQEDKKQFSVNANEMQNDYNDDVDMATEWSALSSLLPSPPRHSIRAPIVQTILEQWTPNKSLHSSLYAWLDQALDGSYHPDSIPPLTLCSLDQQVRDGFLLHILPILRQRPDLSLNVKTRRHTVHDIAVTVKSISLASLLETTATSNSPTAPSDVDVASSFASSTVGASNSSSVVTHHSTATTEVTSNQQRKERRLLSIDNRHRARNYGTDMLIRGEMSDKNQKSIHDSLPNSDKVGRGVSYDEVAEDITMTPGDLHSDETGNDEASGLLLGAFGGALGGLLGMSKRGAISTPAHASSSLPAHRQYYDQDPNESASYGYDTTPSNYRQYAGNFLTPPAFFGYQYNDVTPSSRSSNSSGERMSTCQNQQDASDAYCNDLASSSSSPYHRIVLAPSGRIGATFVEYRGHCYVSDIHDDSPLNGFLHESDILLAIDEITVSGMRVRDIIQILKDRQHRPQRSLRVMSAYDANAAVMMMTTTTLTAVTHNSNDGVSHTKDDSDSSRPYPNDRHQSSGEVETTRSELKKQVLQ